MELKLQRSAFYFSETLLDTTAEQPIECDVLLPDYCPDIVRILRCGVTPVVASPRLSGDSLVLDGMALIEVLYQTPDAQLARAEYKVPFSRSIELRGEVHSCTIPVQAKLSYVNCRAVNQRRLDIRGAVSLSAKVWGTREQQVIAGCAKGDLQLRRESMQVSCIMGDALQEAALSELLELPQGKPSLQKLLHVSAVVSPQETKVSAGKILIKSDLMLHLFYQTNENGYETADFSFPVSMVAEQPGIDEKTVCNAVHRLTALHLEPVPEEGGSRKLELEAVVQAQVCCCKNGQAVYCSDGYSISCPCSVKMASANAVSLAERVDEHFSLRQALSLPESVDTVLDLWGECGPLASQAADGKLRVQGVVTICLLCRMKEGEISLLEKTVDAVREYDAPQRAFAQLSGTLLGCTMERQGTQNSELCCELRIAGMIFSEESAAMVEELKVDTENPRTDRMRPGLYLYLPDQGETVWEIAKHYSTSPEQIEEENPDAKEGCALLVPVL